jgi:hypothetical protein
MHAWRAAQIGILPYAGVDIATFELLKEHLLDVHDGAPPPYTILGAGMLSSTIAQFVSYPLALTRTRLQARRAVPRRSSSPWNPAMPAALLEPLAPAQRWLRMEREGSLGNWAGEARGCCVRACTRACIRVLAHAPPSWAAYEQSPVGRLVQAWHAPLQNAQRAACCRWPLALRDRTAILFLYFFSTVQVTHQSRHTSQSCSRAGGSAAAGSGAALQLRAGPGVLRAARQVHGHGGRPGEDRGERGLPWPLQGAAWVPYG